jgi:hypothetical protein
VSKPEKRSISIKEAAELMGKSEQFIRIGLQRELLKFGVATKMPNSSHYTYYISPKLFFDFIGRDENEEVDQ